MRDHVYAALLSLSLVFGIPLCLADPSFTILYALMIAMAPLAARGAEYYRSLLGPYVPGREEGADYRWALLGLVPVPFAFAFSWMNWIYGLIAVIVVAVAEETFRAGSVVLLKDQLQLDPWLAITIANTAWIAYHFVLKPFSLDYLAFLLLGAFVFTLALVKGGLGAAVLAHILANSLAAWVVISVTGTSAPQVNLMLGVVLVLIALLIGVSGVARKRG